MIRSGKLGYDAVSKTLVTELQKTTGMESAVSRIMPHTIMKTGKHNFKKTLEQMFIAYLVNIGIPFTNEFTINPVTKETAGKFM